VTRRETRDASLGGGREEEDTCTSLGRETRDASLGGALEERMGGLSMGDCVGAGAGMVRVSGGGEGEGERPAKDDARRSVDAPFLPGDEVSVCLAGWRSVCGSVWLSVWLWGISPLLAWR